MRITEQKRWTEDHGTEEMDRQWRQEYEGNGEIGMREWGDWYGGNRVSYEENGESGMRGMGRGMK